MTDLKVAHVPFTFAPDPIGGTEIFVEALANQLRCCGIESVILAPSCHGVDQAYEHNGLRVRRYRTTAESRDMLQELYGGGDPEAAAGFARMLDEERPDAVHVHAFTRAVSILIVRAAKQRGIPVFFTYHTPTVSCQRGTLMLWGREQCDGKLNVVRCTGCSLEGRGLPRWASALLSHVPLRFGHALETAKLNGGPWTALRMPVLVQAQHAAFRALMQEVDGVVALTEWVKAILIRNGVPLSKITLSRHGLSTVDKAQKSLVGIAETPLRVAFLGRADPVKGADTLIKAVRMVPDLKIQLDFYGVTQGVVDEEYWHSLRSLAANDLRLKFLPPVANKEVVSVLKEYHLLAVPSRWLETGPLVVLEALAAGTPVIGSRLGGIAEWLRHEENGLLVEPENVAAWCHALRRCGQDRRFLQKMREGVTRPRQMADVACEMAQLYRGKLANRRQL